MTAPKRKRLESAVAALQRRYGPRALYQGVALPAQPLPPAIATGFPQLDALTGCQGIPLRALTLLSGKMTSGKLTIAYKLLASAQSQPDGIAALLDLNHSADPDYLHRCGINLEQLFLVRPTPTTQLVQLLIDLIATNQLRLLVVDTLADLLAHPDHAAQLQAQQARLLTALHAANCALLIIDEYLPLWQRWFTATWPLHQAAALHIELRREQWLPSDHHSDHKLAGYCAQARLLKSRWSRPGRTATIAITFNGAVRAQPTW